MARDPFANYDAWLERPYQERAAEGEAIEHFAETHDLPLETPEDWNAAADAMADERMVWEEERAEAIWEERRLGY